MFFFNATRTALGAVFRRSMIAAAVFFVGACTQKTNEEPSGEPAAAPRPVLADTIFTAATIYTADPAKPTAQAVAVKEGIIIAVGSKADMAAFTGPTTASVSAGTGTLYPGFTDAHAHLIGIGLREMTLNLEGTPSIAALKETVARKVAALAPGAALYGRGWIETGWPEGRFPNRFDLDAVAPDNPVILERADGHAMVVNSATLTRANITAETPDPDGGRIDKDENGQPTGLLIDRASDLVSSLISQPDDAQRRKAYRVGADVYAAYGWTGLHNMSVPPRDIDLMEQLASEPHSETNGSALPIRVYNSIDAYGLDTLLTTGARSDESGRIITRAIKVYADGALGSRGAALFDPYADQPETKGLVLIDSEDAVSLYKKALDAGLQVNTHAIGDRGNRLVIDWFSKAVAGSEIVPEGARFRIEHAQIVRPQDISDIKRLGLIASMQPSHAIGDLFFAPDRLGTERLNGAYAWQSMIEAGVIVAGGSDAPVERGDPRIEFYAAVARRGLDGTQTDDWHAEEAVTRENALKMFTLWPAYASFQEDQLGTITVGKRADFTAFSADIMTIPAEEILTVETVLTVVDGAVIFPPN
ncbi:MAG: amidohydrolase [Pseudomonadota bacterium]